MENSLENIFENNTEAVVDDKMPKEGDTKNLHKKEKTNAMKAAFKETLAEDPTFKEKLRSMSDQVEVINTLGWGDGGNIVVDKKSPDRALVGTSAIVGYRVRNNGTESLRYKTEAWAKGEDGKYYSSPTEKTLAPGAVVDLTRQYMTMLCAQPEISFQLSNGKIIRGSGGSKGDASVKAELEAYYFCFNKDVNKNVNADDVKLAIGAKGADDKWHVLPEFEETFGFLNNPKENKTSRGRSAGEKFTSQDLAANYINRLIQVQGM